MRPARQDLVPALCATLVVLGLLVVPYALLRPMPAQAESGAATSQNAVQTVSGFDRQTATPYRFGVSSADPAQITSAALAITGPTTLVPEFDNRAGRQSIPLTAYFTNPSATVTVYLVGYWRDPTTGLITGFKFSPDLTITAPAANHKDPSGNYVAPTHSFDSMGAAYLRLYVVTAVSSGTVSFGLGSN